MSCMAAKETSDKNKIGSAEEGGTLCACMCDCGLNEDISGGVFVFACLQSRGWMAR